MSVTAFGSALLSHRAHDKSLLFDSWVPVIVPQFLARARRKRSPLTLPFAVLPARFAGMFDHQGGGPDHSLVATLSVGTGILDAQRPVGRDARNEHDETRSVE